METIPRLYKDIRRGANYNQFTLLKNIKEKGNIWTKSGLMVGLGEKISEIFDVMRDMRKVKVDF